MKAWRLNSIGDFEYTDIDTPQINPDEVMVRVMAAGICGSDIPRVYRDGAHNMPLTIGHEFSGQVVEVGDKVSDLWSNKRVGIFPLIPCKDCIACKQKKYEMCRNYSYLGSRQDGGFAEYVSVPEWNLIELPDSVSYEEAAMLEPMAVAAHAMRRMEFDRNASVVVIGLGTIGMFLTMLLLEKGCNNIFVIGNKEFQKCKVMELGIGAGHYCDSKNEDAINFIKNNTDSIGADIIFECVGRNETYIQAVDMAAPSGQVMLVGNPNSDMELPKSVYWKILRNQLTVRGTWNSSFTHDENDDWNYVLKCLNDKCIEPGKMISHRYNLENIIRGFKIMRDKSEDYIKVMCSLDVQERL